MGENVALDDGDEGSDLINGILKKILLDTYEVEVSESLEVFLQTKKWDLLKMSDQASFDRMEEALEKIPHQPSPLRDVLLGLTPPSSNSTRSAPILYRNKYLDDSQKSAVQFALEQKELAEQLEESSMAVTRHKAYQVRNSAADGSPVKDRASNNASPFDSLKYY